MIEFEFYCEVTRLAKGEEERATFLFTRLTAFGELSAQEAVSEWFAKTTEARQGWRIARHLKHDRMGAVYALERQLVAHQLYWWRSGDQAAFSCLQRITGWLHELNRSAGEAWMEAAKAMGSPTTAPYRDLDPSKLALRVAIGDTSAELYKVRRGLIESHDKLLDAIEHQQWGFAQHAARMIGGMLPALLRLLGAHEHANDGGKAS